MPPREALTECRRDIATLKLRQPHLLLLVRPVRHVCEASMTICKRGVFYTQLERSPGFTRAGLGIAVGNASPTTRSRAHAVTTSSGEGGFTHAMDHFVLRATVS